jgi:hypothetical protein
LPDTTVTACASPGPGCRIRADFILTLFGFSGKSIHQMTSSFTKKPCFYKIVGQHPIMAGKIETGFTGLSEFLF